MILIKEAITISPSNPISLQGTDFLLRVGYGSFDETGKMYCSSDKTYNIEKNQFDIFEDELVNETTYVFCFVVPKLNSCIPYDDIGIFFLVFERYILFYMFNQELG